MKLRIGLILLIASLATIPSKAARADGEVAKADVDKFVAFIDKLVDTIVADKDDCPKMATDINKLVDANADLLKKGAEARKAGKKLPKDAQDHVSKSTQRLMDGLQKCGNDKGVQNAMQRMKMEPSK